MILHSQIFGEGPDILICHGYIGSSDNWRFIAKKLASNYTIHCIDCRNHGESFHRDTMTYQDMSKDVEAYISDKKLTNVSLIGHSMGGKIVMQMATNQPNRYNKIIIVDIAPVTYTPHHQAILKALKETNLSELTTIKDCDNSMKTHIKNDTIRGFIIKNIKRNEYNQLYWKINVNAIINNYNEILKAPQFKEQILSKTLVINGESSEYNILKDKEIFKKWCKHLTFNTINGVGHWVQAEAPTEFYNLITPFLKRK